MVMMPMAASIGSMRVMVVPRRHNNDRLARTHHRPRMRDHNRLGRIDHGNRRRMPNDDRRHRDADTNVDMNSRLGSNNTPK
jgi:hypothetical protein